MSKVSLLKNKRSEVLSAAQSALMKEGPNSPEYRRLISESDTLEGEIRDLERLDEFFKKTPSARPVAESAPAPVTSIAVPSVSKEQRRTKANAAVRSLLRHGYNPQLEEQRDLTVNADGIATIPQAFDPVWTQALKYYGPIATLVKQAKQDAARPRKLIISDDSAATMTYLPETSNTSSLQVDPVLLSKIPGADTLVTVVRFSYQELEDAENLDQFLSDIAGLRVARAVEYALTLGKDNGTNTALPNSPVGGLLGNVPTGATTGSLAAGIGFADLEALAGSVDQAYFAAPNSGFMASPSVFRYLASLKDSTSRPYFNVDPATGLLQILGKPLYINNAMPAYNVASSPVALFGDLSHAYAYLNVGGVGIQVLRERYLADNFSAAAVIHHRIGAATLVSGSVKALVTAAS